MQTPTVTNPALPTVVFQPADTAGCGYYRAQVPGRALQRNGFANVIQIDPGENTLPVGDVLVLQRNVDRTRLMTAMKARDQYDMVLAVEEDDNFRALPPDNPAFAEFHPNSFKGMAAYVYRNRHTEDWGHENWKLRAEFIKVLLKLADESEDLEDMLRKVPRNGFHAMHTHTIHEGDIVTVTTEHLAETYAKINPNVYILPNCLDFQEPVYSQRNVPHDGVIISWAGSLTHLGDFRVCYPAIEQVMKDCPEARLMIGTDFNVFARVFAALPGVPGFVEKVKAYFGAEKVIARNIDETTANDEVVSDCGRYIYRKGVPPDRFPGMFCDADVGIVPARPGMSFYEAKSDLKGLEFAGMGVATICSPTGQYRLWRSEENGALIPRLNRHKFWYKYLRQLIDDPGYRADMAERAHEWALTRSIDRWAPHWMNAYTDGKIIHDRKATQRQRIAA